MANHIENHPQTQEDAVQLRNRLEETEETLRAIRQYMVDAFVVTREDDVQVITLSNAGFPYQKMVESMNEGAVTLISDGTIFYCNPCFARMVKAKEENLIGVQFKELITQEQRDVFEEDFKQTNRASTRGEFVLRDMQGGHVSIQLSMYALGGETNAVSIIATDITERIQTEEKIRSLASELTIAEHEERHRISQLLHDDLQQHLFAIKAQLSFLDANDDASKIEAAITQMQRSLDDAIKLTRNLSVDLSPSVLHGEGLAQAILWLCARMREQYGLQLKISTNGHIEHPNDQMRVLLFQTVRELLFNIVKHANTTEATITLENIDGRGRIIISDSGRGFDPEILVREPASAHGLLLLQDRLKFMGGSMKIESQPGDGTRILVEIPLPEDV